MGSDYKRCNSFPVVTFVSEYTMAEMKKVAGSHERKFKAALTKVRGQRFFFPIF